MFYFIKRTKIGCSPEEGESQEKQKTPEFQNETAREEKTPEIQNEMEEEVNPDSEPDIPIAPKAEEEKTHFHFLELTKQLNELVEKFDQLQERVNNSFEKSEQSMTNFVNRQLKISVEDIINNIPKNNDAALQEILATVANNQHQSKLIGDMHSEIQKLRSNFYLDLKLPLILDIIDMLDDVKRIFSIAEKESDYIEKLKYYQREINSHIDYSKGKLLNREISSYQSDPFTTKYDGNIHEITEAVETSEKEKHNIVAESLDLGYIWKISDSKEEIIRREKVKVYKYYELGINN